MVSLLLQLLTAPYRRNHLLGPVGSKGSIAWALLLLLLSTEQTIGAEWPGLQHSWQNKPPVMAPVVEQ